MKQLMSGNEAIARGAWEAGVRFAAGYPGTPSTAVLEVLSTYDEVDAQWSTNEKVAFDECMGAALGGVRTMVTMKHVGLNVAADPFMVFPYAGTNAGFVALVADDPGMYSSQNEQDSRYFAKVAKVPLLEPTDAGDALGLVKAAFELSERFETPVMFRTTTRLSHTRGVVEPGQRKEVNGKPFPCTLGSAGPSWKQSWSACASSPTGSQVTLSKMGATRSAWSLTVSHTSTSRRLCLTHPFSSSA